MATNTVGGLRHELDQEGCAYGQVSRERMAHIQATLDRLAQEIAELGGEITRVEARLTYVLGALALQFIGFFIGVVMYLVQRGH